MCFDKLNNQAGVDSAWEQKKLEARKMLDAKRAADWASELQANIAQPKRMSAGHPHLSSARFVSPLFVFMLSRFSQ